MLTLTSILMRGVLAVATVGFLAVLADGAVRSQLERAVQANLSFVGRSPASVRIARPDERYTSKGLDRNRLSATVRMVGTDNAQ